MMKIRHILYVGAALLMAGCSSDENLGDATLSGNGKTPLRIEASLGAGQTLTRAESNRFEEGDVLLAYLRHVTGDTKGSYTPVTADQAPRLVALKKGSETMSGDAVVLGTSDLASVSLSDYTTAEPLFWDDFSEGGIGDAKHLRTTGHGLQSFYGYCFNGGGSYNAAAGTSSGNISTNFNPAAGTLGWTVPTSYSNATDVKHADLLWSEEQAKETYDHTNSYSGDHGTLTIPYTHAMSEVTVTLRAGAGFGNTPLTSATLTLNGMNTVASLTAPTGEYSSGTEENVTMYGDAYSSGPTRNYTAIVAPATKLTEDQLLLNINSVEGNNYRLDLTAGIISDWSSQLTDKETYYETKPGVNYHIDVTVNKVGIDVTATIENWTTVNATGTGEIQLPVVVSVSGDSFNADSQFSLFQLLADGNSDEASERTNAAYQFVTVPTYSGTAWSNTPTIFWPNSSTNYYFRALARDKSGTPNHEIDSVGVFETGYPEPEPQQIIETRVSQGSIAEGHDMLWGTTPEYGSFDEGAPQTPRKNSDVPIKFYHAMSKVTFQLETASGEVNDNSPAVNLTGATIAISNLATKGTIAIEDGAITPAAKTVAAIAATVAPITDLIVVPQSIGNDAIVTITLSDGTTYKLQLNQCVNSDSEDNPKPAITAWERGKHYTYTIHLEKEEITFRALIKDWETKNGSGNANLEWD